MPHETPCGFGLIARVILMAAATTAVAQSVASSPQSVPAERAVMAKPLPAPVDPQIAAALKQVSAAQIRATIEKLVSFGTRLTIGENPAQSGRGIVAAREWINSEFQRYSQACGGCLEVKTDVFTEQPRPRFPSRRKL
ncbi:MAG: hypothetical protein ACHP9S_05445 [Terriglobales bacterium]